MIDHHMTGEVLVEREIGLPFDWKEPGRSVFFCWMRVSVLKSYAAKNREALLRFERALGDAMNVYCNQKEKTIGYLMEFLGSNRDDTEYAYQAYAKWADRNPRPKTESIKNTLTAIAATTLAAAKADPTAFIDTSFVDQLLKEGYFK